MHTRYVFHKEYLYILHKNIHMYTQMLHTYESFYKMNITGTYKIVAMTWIVFLSNLHIVILIPNETESGGKVFRRLIKVKWNNKCD